MSIQDAGHYRCRTEHPDGRLARKILISINTSWNIYNFRAGLIGAFRQQGYEIIAASPTDAFTPHLEELGCRHLPLPMDNKGTSPLKDFGLFLRYLRLLRRERPDVFLGYTIKPNIYGSLAAHLLRVPVVNNVSGLGTAFIRDNWLTRIVKALYRLALRSSATVFFQNEDDRALFTELKLVDPEQTALLPGSGIDLGTFRPILTESQKLEAPCFLLIARLLWDKGIGEFVDAARIVKTRFPDARFQLLGFLDAENRTAISKSAVDEWVRQGIVEYLRVAHDVRPYIAASDCVVLPSYREGTPRTLLEAAAMGKPLIATDVPGCRAVVDHGKNGFLCKVRNSADLANKILDFIDLSDKERIRMGRASREKVEREFDENIVIQRYLETIAEIFKAKGKA
ncbi:MAG: glycosyltransferase family 4 protein [Hyphomicrobiales bacterium]|nr:glycosyltransferase family 4 protein [Hyphomicrobiales bacterium]